MLERNCDDAWIGLSISAHRRGRPQPMQELGQLGASSSHSSYFKGEERGGKAVIRWQLSPYP